MNETFPIVAPPNGSALPDLEDVVARARGKSRLELLDLLRADQQQRWHQGEPLSVDAYLRQLPAVAADPELAVELIYGEWILRAERGEWPRHAEYVERFPAYRETLERRQRQGASDSEATVCSDQVTPGDGQAVVDCRLAPEAAPGKMTGQQQQPADRLQSTDRPRARLTHGGAEAPAELPPDETLPEVPGYEILTVLGRGGMGVVYKARQRTLNRLVALKMVLGGICASPADRTRFRAEAEAVARLHHANIVQVYEVGEYQGLPFFSLEYCPGGSLTQKLGGKPLPFPEAAHTAEVLARAVAAAHQAQIVHRDLKPGNVLLGADGTPKVSDFSLAKRLDEAGVTQTGAIMGTPSYMAPEQAAGAVRAVGRAADIYALGAILYEMLTGGPPFRGTAVWETLEQVRTQEPVAPSRLRPKVPRDLETICLKCLHKDPHRRYATAQELADDLARLQRGEPIRGRPTPAWERAWLWARRRPTQALLAATGAVALLAVVIGSLFYSLYQEQQAATLRRDLQRQKKVDELWGQGKEAEAAGEVALAGGQDAEAAGKFALAAERLAGALAALDAEPAVGDDDLRAQIASRHARVRARLQDRAARQDVRDRVKRLLAGRDAILFHDLSFTGTDRADDRKEIMTLAPAALALFNVPADDPTGARRALEASRPYLSGGQALTQVGGACYEILLVWAEAEADAPLPARTDGTLKALRLLDVAEALGAAYGLPAPRALHVRRARWLAGLGQEGEASRERQRAAGLPPSTILDHFLAAVQAYKRGLYPEARAACEKVLAGQPDHFWAGYLQGLCCLKASHWAEARAWMTACVELAPDVPWPWLLRASAGIEVGDLAGAEQDFARALARSADRLSRSLILTNRSVLRVRQLRWDEAVRDLREASTLQPGAYQPWVNLAEVHRRRGDLDEAVAGLGVLLPPVVIAAGRAVNLDQAVAALGAALARHPGDPALYYTRARLHLERGDESAARLDFQAVVDRDRGARSRRLAAAHVELARLRQHAGDLPGALGEADAALRAQPDFAPALRQRAEILLAQGHYAEAGQTLDRYLEGRSAPPEVYAARGIIHYQMREYAPALEAFNRALARKHDATTLSHRGWTYLALDAPRPALADFQAALRLDGGHADALCGRAHARLGQGQLREAVEDAEEALRQGPPTEQLLLKAAGLYARVVGRLEGKTRGPARRNPEMIYRYADRAGELVEAAVGQRPTERERAEFWRRYVAGEPALVPIRNTPRMAQLHQRYSGGMKDEG
jgi:tetratricopeptide (TPR) repeat protein/tRNA A-37 threonylcarbamoyl transferase component Bud32